MKVRKSVRWLGLVAIGLAVFLTLLFLQKQYSKPFHNEDQPTIVAITSTPEPGLEIEGWVRQGDGVGVPDVSIYKAYASYPGEIVATTDTKGYYHTRFFPIPGDEMVSVWPEKPGYAFTPEIYFWRHYHGYEHRQLDFTSSTPDPSSLPLVNRWR